METSKLGQPIVFEKAFQKENEKGSDIGEKKESRGGGREGEGGGEERGSSHAGLWNWQCILKEGGMNVRGKQLGGDRGYGCLLTPVWTTSSQPFRCLPHPWKPFAGPGVRGCSYQWTVLHRLGHKFFSHLWVVHRCQILKTVFISCWSLVRSGHRYLLNIWMGLGGGSTHL